MEVVQQAEQLVQDENLAIDETSVAFIGRWRGLISTTNWEKGRIIQEWREALKSSGTSLQEYSDEAWSRRVGQVSGQHAGRLRRVYERFHTVRASYAGLFWSHFQATLDWSDAEMWLEGAVQSDWSVGEMRAHRWEALGGSANGQPRDSEVADAEFDEDADPAATPLAEVRDPADGLDAASRSSVAAPQRSSSEEEPSGAGMAFDAEEHDYPAESPSVPVRPFEHLPRLPDDVAEAFESFKLAILHHKMAGWRDVSRDGVVESLEALKQLALAPAEA